MILAMENRSPRPKSLIYLAPGFHEIFDGRHGGRAELQRFQGMTMKRLIIGGASVFSDEDMKVLFEGIPGRRLDAAFGGEARQHQRVDALGMKLVGQTGAGKGTEMVL